MTLLLIFSGIAFAEERQCRKTPCNAQGEPLNCYEPAYNAHAVTNVNPKEWSPRLPSIAAFADMSFIYWYAGEEGLTLASNGVYNSGTIYFAESTKTIIQSSDYKPGFMLGAGIVGYGDWQIKAEYTWYRGTNGTDSGTLSGTVPTAGITTPSSGTAVWVVNDWFLQGTPSQALSGSQVSSSWHVSMDLIDLMASRPFYQSRHLIVSPSGGLRSALIRQSMTVNLTESPTLFSSSVSSQPIQSRNHSNSWSVGPRGGCVSQCLLPKGLRIEGSFGLSLLYTRYTSIRHSEDAAATTFNAGPYITNYPAYNCLRPELDAGLGIGWGMYLGNQDYHLDFSMDYDFMIFWSHNMLRRFLDDTLTGTSPGSSDLYFHGLTITGRFDF